ncbi:hypothetical protein LPJ62_000155 [Coemansia sp. RSA 2167]|nr:hypothetical protein LPJ58_004254 [Coemansia sp. RSA 1591]KAJ1793506.1 hypothetical protein LPJ62_000155 [Coemansia sp. RSA 2167]KAJ2190160.1 hypothetical protein GGH18_003320 [Coemansia sp. RSA 530]KAJ2275624.1 hypothetical protein J3F81_001737 [Coemansia sp. RSA 371]
MLHFADMLLGRSRHHKHSKTKLQQKTLEWLPKFILTKQSIEDIRRPHACRKYLVAGRAPQEETPHNDSILASALDGCESCYVTKDDKPACVVCLEEYLVDQDVRVLLCGHVFHDECISEWLVRSTAKFHECPICKIPCFPDEVVKKAEDDANRRPSRHSYSNLVSVF